MNGSQIFAIILLAIIFIFEIFLYFEFKEDFKKMYPTFKDFIKASFSGYGFMMLVLIAFLIIQAFGGI